MDMDPQLKLKLKKLEFLSQIDKIRQMLKGNFTPSLLTQVIKRNTEPSPEEVIQISLEILAILEEKIDIKSSINYSEEDQDDDESIPESFELNQIKLIGKEVFKLLTIIHDYPELINDKHIIYSIIESRNFEYHGVNVVNYYAYYIARFPKFSFLYGTAFYDPTNYSHCFDEFLENIGEFGEEIEQIAVKYNNIEILKKLIKDEICRGSPFEYNLGNGEETLINIFHLALLRRNNEIFSLLSDNLNPSHDGRNLLLLALELKNYEAINMILRKIKDTESFISLAIADKDAFNDDLIGEDDISQILENPILKPLLMKKIAEKCNIYEILTKLPELLPFITVNPDTLRNITSDAIAQIKEREYEKLEITTKELNFEGREVIDVTGDGNCFFRAVSYELYGTEERHLEIRNSAVNYMRSHPADFENIHNLSRYINSVRNDRDWVDDENIILATARAYNVTFVIRPINGPVYHIGEQGDGTNIMRLLYTGNHYMAIVENAKNTNSELEESKDDSPQAKRARPSDDENEDMDIPEAAVASGQSLNETSNSYNIEPTYNQIGIPTTPQGLSGYIFDANIFPGSSSM